MTSTSQRQQNNGIFLERHYSPHGTFFDYLYTRLTAEIAPVNTVVGGLAIMWVFVGTTFDAEELAL